MSSAEFVEKWNSGALGKRLQNHHASDFHLSTLFVDPPRAGLDDATLKVRSQQHRRFRDFSICCSY